MIQMLFFVDYIALVLSLLTSSYGIKLHKNKQLKMIDIESWTYLVSSNCSCNACRTKFLFELITLLAYVSISLRIQDGKTIEIKKENII
jgi:hypothetical protein